MFAQLFKCSKCGEVWQTQSVEMIDTANDDVEVYEVCSKCGRTVDPLLHEGHPVFHVLTEEEMYWDMYSPDEDECDDPFDADQHPRICSTCGGEIAGSYSLCVCDDD